MKTCWRALSVTLAIASHWVLLGCGNDVRGPLIPVQGRVTLADKPLVGGVVTFIPLENQNGSPRPEGEVDSEGNYALKTRGREGAPAGKYRATLTTSGDDKTQSGQFQAMYSHWEKSPLIVDVEANAPSGAYDLQMRPR